MAKKATKNEPEEAIESPEADAPQEPAPTEEPKAKLETEADRRAARKAKRAPRAEELPSVWVRYNQQSGQAAGPHLFGPFPSRNSPSVRRSLDPGQWTEVDGHWGAALQASAIAYMCDFSDKAPK